MLPKISCLCPTYGRPQCLEEAIFSFLTQDYQGEKELIVLNDYGEQTLIFNHPQVRIVNLLEQIRPLGAKFNCTASLATGDLLAIWEDDDIYLPWRLSYSVEHLNEHRIYHTASAWFEEDAHKLVPSRNLYHCNLLMSREVFRSVGSYSEVRDSGAIDVLLFDELRKRYGTITQEIADENRFYIYRWGTSGGGYHASGWGSGDVSELAKQTVNSAIQNGTIPQGEINLVPRWKYNYLEYLPCVT
jgi:glycosyltransferase involved in cell wall biosynthesis